MPDFLGAILELLPDSAIEYLLGRLFLGFQELLNSTVNRLL
jgi:hypothetical protein